MAGGRSCASAAGAAAAPPPGWADACSRAWASCRKGAGLAPARDVQYGRGAPGTPACHKCCSSRSHSPLVCLRAILLRQTCPRPACTPARGKSPDARGGRPCGVAVRLSAAAPGAADGGAALTRALALDWVALHGAGGRVWPALAAAAGGGGAPPPPRERCAWADAPVALAGAPLESARFATVDVGVRTRASSGQGGLRPDGRGVHARMQSACSAAVKVRCGVPLQPSGAASRCWPWRNNAGRFGQAARRGRPPRRPARAQGATAQLPRCAATLRLCGAGRAWRCALCERQYAVPARGSAHGGLPGASCLFCGAPLGPLLPATLLAPPGLR